MPLINYKVELKLRWTKHCVLSVAGTDNVNGNNDDKNIIFTIKDTKLYVPVVTFSARDNQKLSGLVRDLQDQFIGMNIKQKVIIKIQQTNLDFFLNQILLQSIDYFFLVYSNQDAASKRFKSKRYYLPKGIIGNCDVIINGKNFYDQTIDSEIK